jgi:hypothetical protein
VRPLLAAITKAAAPARYFGRDWISVAHRPVALVAYGHDATTQRTTFEAIVACRAPLGVGARASYLGKEPATLDLDPGLLGGAIAEAYGVALRACPSPRERVGIMADPAWTATREEPIGIIAAGRDRAGTLRVGGELMVARDALAALEARVAPETDRAVIGAIVDEILGDPRSALFGVRSLASIRDVIADALAAQKPA